MRRPVFSKKNKINSSIACKFKKKSYLCIAIEKQTNSTGCYQKQMGKYQSGQMGQTVNLLAYAFGGSNPSLPTENQIVIVRNYLIFFFYASWYTFQFNYVS